MSLAPPPSFSVDYLLSDFMLHGCLQDKDARFMFLSNNELREEKSLGNSGTEGANFSFVSTILSMIVGLIENN